MPSVCLVLQAIRPCHLTVSAWLWVREQEGAGCVWREFVDDFFLCFFDQDEHCRHSYEHETQRPKAGRFSL